MNKDRKKTRRQSSHKWTDDGFVDLMEEIYKESEAKGEFRNLPGKGKPIPKRALEGDLPHHILHNANCLPPWLQLQHEIRDEIEEVVQLLEKQADRKRILGNIDAINQKIRQYNQQCPGSFMQKGPISVENVQEQYKKWV
ncbi:DUF1992 domain-containing protein [Kroppenstedtia pulmonis]|uniref:DUF1992 domain-containing protein n=1 Tax=Kroppenstedtia pulmonis TaxID=1380685 RepID=A0A7D3XQW6_9BACL|nr:DUF1992 domain-containing protein [Kroppenstedtia pulmonis]QKG83848.1 DUF1992 domain-containing protein [Kroppenstedtia pulmonis]